MARTGIIESGHVARREPRRCHIVVVLTTAMSSLKERAGVKRGWPAVFAVAAGLQGMMA